MARHFFVVVPLTVLAFAWQWFSLPAMPAKAERPSGNPFLLLARPQVALGMAGIVFMFMGQFSLFTYLRPFLETVTMVDVSTLSLMLLIVGASGLLGTYLIGHLLHDRIFAFLIGIPLAMSVIAILLILVGHAAWAVGVLLFAWGLISTPAPVVWGTWLTRTLPNDAEAGGGLMVATVQLAITLGAGTGGLVFDTVGWWSPFVLAAVLMTVASSLAWMAKRQMYN